MTKTVVNLTLPVVVEEIETVLLTYPDHPYQQVFSIPDLRLKLVAFVLSHIRSYYTVVEETEISNINSPSLHCPSEQRLRMEMLIHEGIEQILQEHADWAIHHIPQTCHSAAAPSDWFG
jgi:hypothetical protein